MQRWIESNREPSVANGSSERFKIRQVQSYRTSAALERRSEMDAQPGIGSRRKATLQLDEENLSCQCPVAKQLLGFELDGFDLVRASDGRQSHGELMQLAP